MSGNIIGQTLLNQFRVDAFVASGGMGAVYRVWDLKRNVPLAMKILHAELAEDPSVLKRFQREARALKKLTHPNIVPFYGLNQTSDFYFLLERYIDGPTLKDILRDKRGPLPMEEALIYFTALCAALGFAHHNGVVHCDVKPGNVMVDRGGNIYLTDFGIARHAESTVTTFGGAGTPAYMAPEQIRDEVVSPATDVYALGILLYEMLTGVRPFRGDESGLEKKGETSGERIRYAQLSVNPPDPRQFNPSVPAELAAVILKAMAKSSGERYLNATEMLETMQAAVGTKSKNLADRVDVSNYSPSYPLPITQDLSEKQISTSKQIHPNIGNNKLITIIGVVALLVVIGALAAGQIGNSSAQQNGVFTSTAIQIPTNTRASNLTAFPTDTATPKIPPNTSSNWIAYTYGTDQDSTDPDPRYLAMINVQTSEERHLTFDNGGINFPSFSPTGDQIVYTGCKSQFCQLYVVDVNSGQTEKIPGINMKAMWPDWCPDPNKNLIAFEGRVGSDWKIYVVDLSTEKVTAITSGPDDGRPAWSPDCSKIVFVRYFDLIGDIYIFDFEDNRGEYAILQSPDNEFDVSWASGGNRIIFTRVSDDTNGDGVENLDDRSDLYLINSDGSGETVITKGKYSAFSPSFSSDGENIVFTNFSGNDSNLQIVVYSLADRSFRVIASNGPFYHTDWSP